jgi:phosphotransferase system  glucose/maltose/N-acetylglucosamine-specific IIC component
MEDNMDEQLVRELIGLVERVSTTVWAAAVREAWVSALVNGVTFIICVVAVVILSRIALVFWRKYQDADHHEDEGWYAGSLLFGGIALSLILVGVAKILLAIRYFLNPEFYAIKLLLGLVS